MTGSYRASVGHPPLIRVKPSNIGMTGQELGFMLGVPVGGYEFPAGTNTASTFPLTAVATFHNISLYWSESSGSVSNEALVRFRKTGTSAWRQGYSLWWDNREQGTDPPTVVLTVPYGFKQYRGSLVQLEADSSYDVEVLTAGTRKLASTVISTWSEVFPEGVVTNLPTTSSGLLTLSQSGTSSAYRVYRPAPGGTALIDRNNTGTNAIRITGAYIIVRGVACRRTSEASIGLEPTAHHIVIEDCDLTEFGRQDSLSVYACNSGGGVETIQSGSTANLGITNIVIQNNKIHHPNFDTNSWAEAARPASPGCFDNGGTHPAGATAIYLSNIGGNSVIRYNEIYSDFAHMFDDGIGGSQNFSFGGNLGRDSDVYGNKISHCWDDVYECEGANMNVRIYENYGEYGLVVMASQGCVSIGPSYVFRNVATRGARTPGATASEGNSYKSYGKTLNGTNPSYSGGTPSQMTYGGGRVYLFHNTIFQSATAEVGNGQVTTVLNADQLGPTSIVSRNNIWHTKNSISSTHITTINSAPAIPGTSWNYDLVGAGHTSWQNIEPNCIVSDPIFDPTHASGPHTLSDASPGRNVATFLPNFNDQYTTPDMGAQERGATALQFGNR